MKNFLPFVVATCLVFGSCTSQVDSKTETAPDSLVVDQAQADHEHAHDEAIVLDNGKKWKVVDHMLAHIRNMESTIQGFQLAKPVAELTDSLKADIDRLTSNCTMEGQAHDELHKWLLPYIDLVDSAATMTSEKAKTALTESFATFNTYFE